ncbi:MAG: 3-oxoacyl-ACP synthase III [Proteobacteria bacterium]|nr:3-oxoacyl-ACP synthase III [Pseudomonadota bacterium]
MRYRQVCIESLSYEVPSNLLRTVDIESELTPLYSKIGMKPGWLQSVTGIRTRRFWDRHLNPSDVATLAAKKAIEQSNLDKNKIGALVSTSVCKDYLEPSVAAFVHGNLKLPTSCMNFDAGNACLGFLTGMNIVADMIELGKIKSGLVVAGESSRAPTEATIERLKAPEANMSSFRNNLATLTLGSAAVAMVLTHESISTTGHRFLGGIARAATQWSRLCVGTETKMTTDPAKLLKEGVSLAQQTWTAVHKELPLQPEWTKEYALHQVGRANHDSVLQALNLPPNKALRVYIDHGNVGACGVPLTLAMLIESGRVQQGDRVGLMGIGSGLNVMMMGVQW